MPAHLGSWAPVLLAFSFFHFPPGRSVVHILTFQFSSGSSVASAPLSFRHAAPQKSDGWHCHWQKSQHDVRPSSSGVAWGRGGFIKWPNSAAQIGTAGPRARTNNACHHAFGACGFCQCAGRGCASISSEVCDKTHAGALVPPSCISCVWLLENMEGRTVYGLRQGRAGGDNTENM